MTNYKNRSNQEKVVTADTEFEKYWEAKEYDKALAVYYRVGRMFWFSEQVGYHYERSGLIEKALIEYEYLISEYERMKILTLPKGPDELFKLGKWYADKNRNKAKAYLNLYLSAADEWKGDPAFYLAYKEEAKNILKCLEV